MRAIPRGHKFYVILLTYVILYGLEILLSIATNKILCNIWKNSLRFMKNYCCNFYKS